MAPFRIRTCLFSAFVFMLPSFLGASSALNEIAAYADDSMDKLVRHAYDHFNMEAFESWRAAFFVLGLVATILAAKFLAWFIGKKLAGFIRRTETLVDDLVLEALGRPVALAVLSTGLYLSAIPLFLLFSDNARLVFGRICLASFASSIAWAIYRLVAVLDHVLHRFAQRSDNSLDDMIVAAIRRTLKVAIFLLSAMFIGQNILHLNITALLAGAGVAGLAIAFAAQDTIANFFGSVMILLDRPFKLGDRVVVSGTDGIVENIGFRSTKIRTLGGHLVTVPNKKIADSEIENISGRPHIKHSVNLTVTYDTRPEKVERAVAVLHEIFDGHECSERDFPPRIYFASFGDWALNISATCWYHSPDYWKFQEWVHRSNIEILRRFNDEGIEFAFPTNTTFIAGDPGRRPELAVFNAGIPKTEAPVGGNS